MCSAIIWFASSGHCYSSYPQIYWLGNNLQHTLVNFSFITCTAVRTWSYLYQTKAEQKLYCRNIFPHLRDSRQTVPFFKNLLFQSNYKENKHLLIHVGLLFFIIITSSHRMCSDTKNENFFILLFHRMTVKTMKLYIFRIASIKSLQVRKSGS